MAEQDVWWWWRKALAGGVIGSAELPVHDGVPQAGFYRMKDWGLFVPVAIWWSPQLDEDGERTGDDTLICVVGFDKKLADACKVWNWCCKHPISKQAYDRAIATKQWEDVDAAVTKSLAPPPMGHNAPDEMAVLIDQIASVADAAKAYDKITDGTAASRAQGLRARALELEREANKKREIEKRPHLQAGKDVDDKWRPLVSGAKAISTALGKSLGDFLTAEDRKRRAAERAAAEAAAVDQPVPPLKELVQRYEPVTQIRGGYGTARPVKTVKVITKVTDWDALFGLLRNEQIVQEVMLATAQKLLNSDVDVPGVEIEERKKVA